MVRPAVAEKLARSVARKQSPLPGEASRGANRLMVARRTLALAAAEPKAGRER
jgi:hypothetical protein